jgi:osmotically-inducible protein OsmY
MRPKDKELTRQEDYRDNEQRDIEEGWPYDDAAGERSRKVENAPYGTTHANFDSATSKGYTVTGIDERGQQERQAEPLLPGSIGRESADDLEERVMDALMDVEGIGPEMIDVRVEGSHVILEGDVDDMITAHRLTARVLTVSGVGEVTNNLMIIGIDANMPDDD